MKSVLAVLIFAALIGFGGSSANAQISGYLSNNASYALTDVSFSVVSGSGTITTHPAPNIAVNDSSAYVLNFSSSDVPRVSFKINGTTYSGDFTPDTSAPQPAMRVDAAGHLWERRWLQWVMLF